MEYTTLGNSGLKVSRIGIGCGQFGWDDPTMLDGEAASELVDRAIDLGVNFFDTANAYSMGASEEILGEALVDYDRDWPVVATKVYLDVDPENPNASGLSRKAIEQELENSLARLGMDTVDLYQIHRWDDETAIEVTLRTLDHAVRRKQVRYIGASSMYAYQFARALATSDRLGIERFATMQNHHNLVYREEEREMIPLCREEGVGVIPWSPLAKGFLARPAADLEATLRGEQYAEKERMRIYRSNGGDETNERVAELAEEKGVTMAQISLAWLLHQDGVDAPVVGMTAIEHLEDAVEAVEISLSDSELAYLEEPYRAKPVSGFDPGR